MVDIPWVAASRNGALRCVFRLPVGRRAKQGYRGPDKGGWVEKRASVDGMAPLIEMGSVLNQG